MTDNFSVYQKPYDYDDESYDHMLLVIANPQKWLHIIIGNAKALVQGTFHGLAKKHLQSYLDEFCYRFNRRFVHGEIFSRLVCAVTASSPLRFADLA